MTINEKFSEEKPVFPVNLFDGSLKQKCLDLMISTGLSKFRIPHHISNSITKNLAEKHHLSVLIPSSRIVVLRMDKDISLCNSQSIKVMVFDEDSLFSYVLLEDILKIETLYVNEILIPTKSESFMTSLGTAMERVKNLQFGSVKSNDFALHTDEIFIQLSQSYLSKNRDLLNVDLRGSDVDVVADCSKRNLKINFAAELRRWARRLRGLAFESEINLCRVLRILNRQIPLLKFLCISPGGGRTVCEVFDNLKSISSGSGSDQKIEKLTKLHSLCLCRHFKVTDTILKTILTALPALKYLNLAGCAVNFEQYWNHLPDTIEELVIDECDRSTLLKFNRSSVRKLLRKCPNLRIFISPPIFQDQELESLRGLALLNGANSILSDNFDNYHLPEDDLIAFELRIKELEKCTSCIKLF